MELEEIQRDGVLVVALAGKMDANTVTLFNERFAALIGEGRDIFVVDLSRLDYISSAGLRGVLAAVKKSEAAGGKLFLNGLNGLVHDAFHVSGFLHHFETFAARDEAVAAAAALVATGGTGAAPVSAR